MIPTKEAFEDSGFQTDCFGPAHRVGEGHPQSQMAAAATSKGAKIVVACWTGFLVENVVLTHNREWLIARFGDERYHQFYNICSTVAVTSIAVGYWKYGRGRGMRHQLYTHGNTMPNLCALSAAALGGAGMAQMAPKLQVPFNLFGDTSPSPRALAPSPSPAPVASSSALSDQPARPPARFVRCPIDFTPTDIPADGVYGIKRITRHPFFWSWGVCCLAPALTTPLLAEVAMWSMPILFAAVGTTHQDYRYRRGSGGTLSPEVEAVTSNVPFLALLQGRQDWGRTAAELKWVNAGLGVLVCCILLRGRLRPC
eukprot:g9054.t1